MAASCPASASSARLRLLPITAIGTRRALGADAANDYAVSIAQDWDGTPAHAMLALRAPLSTGDCAGRRPTARPRCARAGRGTHRHRPVPRHPDRRAGTGLAAPGMRWSCCKSVALTPCRPACAARARVIFQSSDPTHHCPNLPARCAWSWWVICAKRHPRPWWQAAQLLRGQTGIHIEHIGEAGNLRLPSRPRPAWRSVRTTTGAVACP